MNLEILITTILASYINIDIRGKEIILSVNLGLYGYFLLVGG